MKKKILITGASGFLGTNLISRLSREKKLEIYGLIKKKTNKILIKKNVKYICSDITKTKKKIDINFEYVINLAGNINHKDKVETLNAHYKGVKNLLKIINYKRNKLFIQIGSSLEYGQKKSPQKENFTCRPISYYGKAKLLATKYIQKKMKKYLILRPYQIYGPHQKNNRLIPIIIDGCLKNKSFACTEGKQYRDFLYIDDFSELILKILKTKKNKNGIYNVGFGSPIQVKSMINFIKKKIKKGKPLFGKIKMRKEEMKYAYPDIRKVKKNYKWKPKVNISAGLKKTIAYYAK